jgi:hypothetical protein
VSTKKHHVQQNVHNTVVLSSKFCTDIIFSLGNMKLFVSFFHITAVKWCHNLSDIIIEEIVCRNTCFECNYNIWITFYIFLWNYESIKGPKIGNFKCS